MKVAIFDFDDTLVHEGFSPYILCSEAEDVLRQAIKEGYILCIASFNIDVNRQLMESLFPKDIMDHFSLIYGLNNISKWEMVNDILQCIVLNNIRVDDFNGFEDVVFFDDLQENIDGVDKMLYGVRTKLVDYMTGITMQDWKFE